RPFFSFSFANPSSFHSAGLTVQRAVQRARKSIASMVNVREDEVIFCSGGTESDNLALLGVIRFAASKPHVITSAIEHPAVLVTLQQLQKRKEIDLTMLPVDSYGRVNPKQVASAIRKETILISIMYANNEIGTIQPIAEIGREILKWRKTSQTPYPYFHSDACQAAGVLDLDVQKLHTDLLTFNGSKIYGPKGIGVLVVKRGMKLEPLIYGGGQEKGLRSGTENVPGIIGIATALEIAQEMKNQENNRLIALRDRLTKGLLKIPKSRLNGHPADRLPNNVNISFLDIEGEAAVLYLDAKGVQASTGSACASTTLDPSHVILATGVSYEAAHGSIRFTLGRSTTQEEIDFVIKIMPGIVKKLRHMSPVNLDTKYFGHGHQVVRSLGH
ncbi:aminotransferase class V-fold PLP-dependent enzyme, partial [Candidatus Uhrbacteria bacterium]|nr:aminotransferase class V-fold PLP-dependent enzyme [Candidatus Uhrbacteria bacterium]MBD3284602.1 aminotransferase class V-fold PLP-dependent enzyme [Candidatus Uhrbacteria bacterium]